MVVGPLIQAADKLAARQVNEAYSGTYTADLETLNSSVTLSYSSTHGLEVTEWTSNSTDMLAVIPLQFNLPQNRKIHTQLTPTGLHRHVKEKKGELWRLSVNLERPGVSSVWDDQCIDDVDTMIYAGRPLNELAFWNKDEKSGRFGQLELTAFRVNLTRTDAGKAFGSARKGEGLLAQQL